MKALTILALLALPLVMAHCARVPVPGAIAGTRSRSVDDGEVIAIHLLSWTSDSLLVELGKTIPTLADRGINLIFLEVDYSFEFQSHPELRQGTDYITRDGARQFAAICRAHGIRLVPQFQSLGHQSWAEHTFPLLTVYPELDLTPGAFPGNEGLYCREWDVTNPRVNEIVFPLIDEIVEAFDADGIHAGMDEIFLLSSEHAPNTRDQDPAELFARVVNEFHDHFVKEKGLELFIWADRLIDAEVHQFGSWEASANGTAPAVDLIPTDVILCDWHYEARAEYTSIPMFLEKGFRVLPTSWHKIEGVEALVKYSYRLSHPNMIGHLFSTWGRGTPERLMAYPPMLAGVETIRGGRYHDVSFDLVDVSGSGVLQVALSASDGGLAIHYTDDGSDPSRQTPLYEQPVSIDHSVTLKAVAFENQTPASEVCEQDFVVHRATGRDISLETPPSPKYPAVNGVATLVNGLTGSGSYGDGQWVGADGEDLVAHIDLGTTGEISSVTVGTLNSRGSWVYHSPLVEVFGSDDGEHYGKLGEAVDVDSEDTIVRHEVRFAASTARYVKVHIHHRTLPEGHEGAGQGAWVFVDEIAVR